MGNDREYISSGGFDQYLYYQIGETISATNGIQGKIINEISDKEDFHSSLPKYSNTSEVYFKLDDQSGQIEQARIYKDRKVSLDFDWGHPHKELPQGVVHVHEWHRDKKGKWSRDSNPRYLNDYEINRYGDLLKLADPHIKFRP